MPDTDPVPPPPDPRKPASRSRQRDEDQKEFKVPAIGDTQKGLHAAFNLLSRFLGSETRFEEREFEDEARGLTSFGKRLRMLALLLPWLGPLVVALSIADKVNRIREGRRAAQERRARERSAGETPLGWVGAHVQSPQPGDMFNERFNEQAMPERGDGSEPSAADHSAGPVADSPPTSEPSPYRSSSAGRRPGLSGIVTAARLGKVI